MNYREFKENSYGEGGKMEKAKLSGLGRVKCVKVRLVEGWDHEFKVL